VITHRYPVLGLCAVSALLGCSNDPLPPSEVQSQVSANLGDLLREASQALADGVLGLPPPAAFSLIERAVGVDTPVARAFGQIAALFATPAPSIDVPTIVDAVNEKIFSDAHYHGDGIYELSPAVVCALILPGHADGCAALLTQLDVRLSTMVSVAETAGLHPSHAGFIVGVQIGPGHIEPLTIALTTDPLTTDRTAISVTADLDLDVLQRALATLPRGTSALATSALSGQLTAVLAGDPTGASFQIKVGRSLSIAVAGPSGDIEGADAFSLTSAQSGFLDAVFTIDDPLPGNLAGHLGQTTIALPAGADGKRHGIAVPRLDLGMPLENGKLELAQLSFGGPVTILRDGTPARTIEINPDDGDPLSIEVERTTTDVLHFAPKLDLRMTTDHAVLGDTPAPAFDVSQIVITGAIEATASPDRVELTDGTFDLDTVPAGHGFAATAGQCITNTASTASPPFVQWTVGACH
jgi:hypothetical protein